MENPEHNHQEQPWLPVSPVAPEHTPHLQREVASGLQAPLQGGLPACTLQSTATIKRFFFYSKGLLKKKSFLFIYLRQLHGVYPMPTNKVGKTPAHSALFALKQQTPKLFTDLNHCSFIARTFRTLTGIRTTHSPSSTPACTPHPSSRALTLPAAKETQVHHGEWQLGHPSPLQDTACFASELRSEPLTSG